VFYVAAGGIKTIVTIYARFLVQEAGVSRRSLARSYHLGDDKGVCLPVWPALPSSLQICPLVQALVRLKS
jgi:hypothetical protein